MSEDKVRLRKIQEADPIIIDYLGTSSWDPKRRKKWNLGPTRIRLIRKNPSLNYFVGVGYFSKCLASESRILILRSTFTFCRQ